jgi:hypothetical protein
MPLFENWGLCNLTRGPGLMGPPFCDQSQKVAPEIPGNPTGGTPVTDAGRGRSGESTESTRHPDEADKASTIPATASHSLGICH